MNSSGGGIAADPQSASGMLGREATEGEVEYAYWTQRTPHFVLSTTLNDVSWDNARVMRDVSEVRSLRDEPGAAIYVIGGAALVANLMNEDLVDELRLIVHPIILGGGKSPFAGITDRRKLELVRSDAGRSGRVTLTYLT